MPVDNTNSPYKYDTEYDAYYHKVTGEWLEGKCNDCHCRYCKDRPEKKHILTPIRETANGG